MSCNRSRRSRRRERGSAIIEAAFVTPVFFLLLFGVIEGGVLFRDSLTTTNASREGARSASVFGRAAETDFLVLQTVKHSIAAMGAESIEYVIVYKIDNIGDPVPASCHSGPVNDVCNYYVAADIELALDNPDGTPTGNFRCEAAALDRYWCPSSRLATLTDADLVGVYIKTRHDFITGFFGQTRTLQDETVIRIEPEIVG